MMSVDDIAANAYEAAYCAMIASVETDDAKEDWIELRAEELIKNFDNENDWQILELIKVKLGNHCVDADIYNQFITDICWSQASNEYKKKFEEINE